MIKSAIQQSKARTWFLICGLIIPLGLLLLLALTPLTWLQQLPNQVPVHWGMSGEPDGFQAPGSFIWLMAGIGTGTIILMWALGLTLGKDTMTRRIMAGTSGFLSILMGGLVFATLRHYRGENPGDLSIDVVIVILLIVGVALGCVLGALIRPDPKVLATGGPDLSSPRTALSDSELGVWVKRTDSKTGYFIAVANAVLFIGLMFATKMWWLSVFALLLSLVLVTMFAWNVRVDATGLSVASIARVPKRHLHLDEIESAEVSHVNAMADFGGWGLRTGFSGSTGVILRSGPALQVNMSGNRAFYVTVDNADQGAALLNTLVERSRPTPA